eukprot:6322173-Alexandrium_andersonii.AAC.1
MPVPLQALTGEGSLEEDRGPPTARWETDSEAAASLALDSRPWPLERGDARGGGGADTVGASSLIQTSIFGCVDGASDSEC